MHKVLEIYPHNYSVNTVLLLTLALSIDDDNDIQQRRRMTTMTGNDNLVQ